MRSFVDAEDVDFLDRCLFSVEWVLEYAVLHFSFTGLNTLGSGTVEERLSKALGFID